MPNTLSNPASLPAVRALSCSLIALTLSTSLQAQSNAYYEEQASPEGQGISEIRVNHPAERLEDALRSARHSINTKIDTAVIFTSYDTQAQELRCAGFNQAGELIGKVIVDLAPNGISLLFASDMPQGESFRGKITCASQGEVIASALLLGAAASSNALQVINEVERSGSFIRVPLALSEAS